jgi:chemotaxis protein MotB
MRRHRQIKQQVGHADDWLMTYADTITLLLCLFVVILSITVVKRTTVEKSGNVPIAAQPVNPDNKTEANLVFRDFVPVSQPAADTADDSTSRAVDDLPPLPPAPPPRPVSKAPPVAAPIVVAQLAPPSPAATETRAPHLPDIVNRLKSQGLAATEQDHDRITTLEIGSGAFFSSGSATLSFSGKDILRDVAINLESDALKDYQITVEGHTDDSPISTAQFPSNWELSTARAAAVVHFFLDQGIAAQRLRAAGYADSFPVAPNRDAAGNPIPENQALNRRVVIKLEKIDKADPP